VEHLALAQAFMAVLRLVLLVVVASLLFAVSINAASTGNAVVSALKLSHVPSKCLDATGAPHDGDFLSSDFIVQTFLVGWSDFNAVLFFLRCEAPDLGMQWDSFPRFRLSCQLWNSISPCLGSLRHACAND